MNAVCTNLEYDVSDIIKINQKRWEIEECFRIMKTEFKARPVYLSRKDRITAHFTTCFTALVIYRILEHKLNEKYTCEELIDTIQKASQQAAQTVALNKVPVYQADLTNIQNQFMAVLREIKKDMVSEKGTSQNMTKELTEQMFSELTKGQDLRHPSVSPEQLAAMVVQPISQMGLAEEGTLSELQQALLHMMENMQQKQNGEKDEQ